MAGLLACPQLLSDDFGAALDTGDDTCARRLCAAGGGPGSAGSAAGAAGATLASGGSASSAGGSSAGSGDGAGSGGGPSESADAGNSGEAGTSGAGGSSDVADASVDPSEPVPTPDCWLVALEDATHVASGNCLGVNGWNAIEADPDSDTSVNTTYEDDGVCFTGSIDNSGWGAVFNVTLNATAAWNAASRGVGGFQLEATGSSLPPQLQVKYTDASAGDFCRAITPAAVVEIPFASAHPGCSTSSSAVTDAVDLTYLRVVFPPAASTYAIDFCLAIRAIP